MAQKILIAEDSPVDSLVLRNVLQRAGYAPILVGDGQSALDALRDDSEIQLVIADVQMPALSGIELVREIRQDEGCASLPVIFVSSVADAETVRAAVGLKSSGYVLKPIREPSRLLQMVTDAIGDAVVEA